MTPRGLHTRVTVESLNQKSFPCFKMNHRRLHVLMCSPCFINHPVRSGFDQNSTPSVWVDWVCVRAVAARQRDAMESESDMGGSDLKEREFQLLTKSRWERKEGKGFLFPIFSSLVGFIE